MPDFKSNFPFVEIYIRFQLKYQVLTPFWSCLLLRVSLSAVGFYSTLPSYEHPCLRKTQSHPKFSSYIFPPFFPMFPAANPSAKRTPGSIGCGLHRRELEDELAPTPLLQHPSPGSGWWNKPFTPPFLLLLKIWLYCTCGEDILWKSTGQRTYADGSNINR